MTFSKVCRITPLEPAAAPAFDLIDLLEDDARPPVVLGGVDEAADLDNVPRVDAAATAGGVDNWNLILSSPVLHGCNVALESDFDVCSTDPN